MCPSEPETTTTEAPFRHPPGTATAATSLASERRQVGKLARVEIRVRRGYGQTSFDIKVEEGEPEAIVELTRRLTELFD